MWIHAVFWFDFSSGIKLGRWKNSFQQEDVGLPSFKLTKNPSMDDSNLASTRKSNMDELQTRIKKYIYS